MLIFGAGAVGSILGAFLTRAHDVILVGREPQVQAIRRAGLAVEGKEQFKIRAEARTNCDGVPPVDAILVTVKAYDTPEALRGIRPVVVTHTRIVMAQNGLGNWEQALAAYPRRRVLGASVTYAGQLVAPGRVAWNGGGEVVLGGRTEDARSAEELAGELRRADLQVRTTDNLAGTLWLKAVANAAINPLTAIHRCPNGRLLEDPRLRDQMRQAAQEAVGVAQAEGVKLPAPDPVALVEQIVRQTASNRSSMLQSVERGQRTEIDAITGEILRAARRHGIPCPVNLALLAAVKRLEVPARPA